MVMFEDVKSDFFLFFFNFYVNYQSEYQKNLINLSVSSVRDANREIQLTALKIAN